MSARIKLRQSSSKKAGSHSKQIDQNMRDNISLLQTNSLSKDTTMLNQDRLLLRVMENRGPRRSIIEGFNHWINRNLGRQLTARPFESQAGITKLSNVRVDLQEDDSGDTKTLITPRYCRDNGLTYMGVIRADATFYPHKPTEHDVTSKSYSISHEQKVQSKTSNVEKNFELGKIPIMIMSNTCMLSGLSEGQRLNLGECTNDYGGYYVVEGGERTISSQEGLRTGIFIGWVDKDTGKIEFRMTCAVDYGTTIVSMTLGSKWDTIKVGIHYVGKDKHIPLYVAFAFLGYNESNATDLICHFIPENLRLATLMYLQSSITRGRSVGSRIVPYIVSKKNKQKANIKNFVEESGEVIKAVQKDLFAHISGNNGKAKALAFMAAQIILAVMGERQLDGRDSWDIKKLTPPAKLMEVKLNTLWGKVLADSKENAFKTNFKLQGIKSFTQSVKIDEINNIITQFNKSFMISWTMKNGQVIESITDSLKRDTPAATISQVTRINVSTSRKGKEPIYREVQQSQFGYACSAETPEGETCGLVKNMSSTTSLSLDRDTNDFFTVMTGEHPKYGNSLPQLYGKKPLEFNWSDNVYILNTENPNLAEIPNLQDYDEIQVETEKLDEETEHDYKTRLYLIKEEKINEKFPYPILINGTLVGWCKDQQIEKILLRCRQFGMVSIDSCISFNDDRNCLEIDTTGGRLIRPLLVVDNDGKLVIEEMKAWDYDIDTLFTNGCMMYLDVREQGKIMLAQQVSDVGFFHVQMDELEALVENKKTIIDQLEKKDELSKEDISKDKDYIEMLKYQADLDEMINYPYQYCEIHPVAQLGNLASMIPFPNKIQGPRVTYQASMGKQALNQYHTMHHERFDTSFKVMTSPTIPIYQTETCKPNGLTAMPCGDTIIKAIYAHPDNPEDGIVFNRETIRSGKFRIDKYITLRLVFKKTSNRIVELHKRPPPQQFGNERYHAINEQGIPTLDAYLKTGDCAIGRMRVFGEGENAGKDENASLFVGIGEAGYVDRISITRSSKGGTVVKVKIRQSREQISGDKLASRYSQKGTISIIVDQHLLPRVTSGPNKGMYPDLCVNPHAIPSRMPMAEVIEMLTTKASLYTGERIDATAFNNIDIEYYRQILQKRWDEHIKNHPEDNKKNIYGTKYGSQFADGYEDMEVPVRVVDKEENIGQGPKYLVPSGKYRPCRKPIFMGPCYTQCLRHHVDDKFQVRSYGTLDATTRQPIGGRARAGGQRFGEMERDALISHGATDLILERLMYVSDKFEVIICTQCGHFAVANMQTQIIKCGACGTSTAEGSENKGQFGRIVIPYVFKYLIHLLSLAMIDVTFKTVPVSSFGTGKNTLEDRFVT